MTPGKCSLLKPVNNLTGTFFLFSQYAQDLTKQYSNPDSYRCVPSKFIAMNLDFTDIIKENGNQDFYAKKLGNIFQNYFENSNTFLRNKYKDDWNPEYSRTLLFQTLEKYKMIKIKPGSDTDNNEIGDFGVSKNIQYIGGIDIYSYNDNKDGIGYNEIYCYITNQAKCIDYSMSAIKTTGDIYKYYDYQICGYENATPYNGLTYNINEGNEVYIDKINSVDHPFYSLGQYINSDDNYSNVFIPCCLDKNLTQIADTDRVDENNTVLEKFDINAVLVLYDVVSKYEDDGVLKENTVYRNIPLGIYFTGILDDNCIMSNKITKYVNSEQIYNQGTSYGLRICNRFISNPLSTEIISTETNGSSNASEIAPVLEKMGEVLLASENIIKGDNNIYSLLNNHLSQFKNNKINIPYIRELGKKKYWFVNGKNTGAIAQDETTSQEDLKNEIIREVLENVYTKDYINNMFEKYYTKEDINSFIGESSDIDDVFVTRSFVNSQIADIKSEFEIS